MGNVQFVYRQKRGSKPAGSKIDDPRDFMSKLFDENYDQTKSMYDSLPAGKQAEFKAIFNGKDVMKDSQTAGMWLAEYEDED